MNFKFSEEHQAFRQSVARFVDKEVVPQAQAIDERGEFPKELFSRAGELGYFGLRYPEEIGGSNADMTMFCLMVEEIARGSMSLAAGVAMQCLMSTNFICHFGTEDHRKRLLIPALKGEKIGAFALTEPNAGSDLAAIQTTAVKDGDSYILNGRKTWITNATVADFFTVLATQDKSKGIKGVDFFLVEKGNPGLIIGKKIDKMGVRASETTELAFENCRVPKENLLGEEGTGFKNLMSILNQIRVMTGALSIGLSRAAYDASVKYANERVQFGGPIGKFQAIKHKLAEMAMQIELSTLIVYYGAWLIDQKVKCNKEAAMAKLYASEAANKIADEATRIFASYGFSMEYPAQRYFRDARFLLYGGGTSEILKNIIAGEIGL
ncbi:MAG: acyl-CoA dehydrogenase family protein [Planctomycetes bacterium]|nr:acyl-CoA dehydrogenase family protein [Planctomycetota bacterium]